MNSKEQNQNKEKLIIFDTTLRDGEQSPGASMTKEEKVRIARALEKMQVDVIEAGFAVASPGDFAAVRAVAETVKTSRVCSLSRAITKDIEHAAEAIQPAEAGRIHTFIATSPLHMRHKLAMEPEQVQAMAIKAVKLARNLCEDVEFSCEDAGRSEFDFLCRIIEATIKAGARTINIPDTVGYAMPEQFGALIKRLLNAVPNADEAIFSVHCHNDLGLGVANSLAAVNAGARQVECTINGLGERAGNASLEEVVMAVRTRQDIFSVYTNINTQQIVPCSKLVSQITGFPVQPNKAIVGANAFAHESGIHQDGVLKHRETYEIMSAEDVGWTNNRIVLGKHSGRNAFQNHLKNLGIDINQEQLDKAFVRFKDLADKKHEIYDEDLQALVSEAPAESVDAVYRLIHLKTLTDTNKKPEADLTLSVKEKYVEGFVKGDSGSHREVSVESSGSGPVDAVFKAIEQIAKTGAELELYSVNAISAGTESQGEVSVRLGKEGTIVNGKGADTDIVVASAKAYINAVNLLLNRLTKPREEAQASL